MHDFLHIQKSDLRQNKPFTESVIQEQASKLQTVEYNSIKHGD